MKQSANSQRKEPCTQRYGADLVPTQESLPALLTVSMSSPIGVLKVSVCFCRASGFFMAGPYTTVAAHALQLSSQALAEGKLLWRRLLLTLVARVEVLLLQGLWLPDMSQQVSTLPPTSPGVLLHLLATQCRIVEGDPSPCRKLAMESPQGPG